MCFLLFLRCIVILNDTAGTLEDWDKTEVACEEKKQEKLSQDGVLEGQKDARLMERLLVVPLHNNRGSAYSRQVNTPGSG